MQKTVTDTIAYPTYSIRPLEKRAAGVWWLVALAHPLFRIASRNTKKEGCSSLLEESDAVAVLLVIGSIFTSSIASVDALDLS
jgi:hypothetical protein